MKKSISIILALVLVLAGALNLFAFAQEAELSSPAAIEYEYFEDGSYVITTLYQGECTRGTTSGSKTASYVNSSNVMVWSVTVYGEFSYTGYSSSATSASGNVKIYVTGASLVSRESYTSGSSAVAKATVSYLGVSRPMNVILTCDRNGVLS